MDKRTRELMFSHASLEWFTPLEIYRWLDDIFRFDIDPSSDESNRLNCRVFFTAQDDGLAQDWPEGNVYCNPPYGRIAAKFVKKCKEHAQSGKGTSVMLLANRSDTAWYHDYIYDLEKKDYYPGVKVWPLKGRIRFIPGPGNPMKGDPAGFPSIVVIFEKQQPSAKEEEQKEEMSTTMLDR